MTKNKINSEKLFSPSLGKPVRIFVYNVFTDLFHTTEKTTWEDVRPWVSNPQSKIHLGSLHLFVSYLCSLLLCAAALWLFRHSKVLRLHRSCTQHDCQCSARHDVSFGDGDKEKKDKVTSRQRCLMWSEKKIQKETNTRMYFLLKPAEDQENEGKNCPSDHPQPTHDIILL